MGASCKWINDGQNLLLEQFDAIHDSPSQIYHSALPFSPPSSWLCRCYDTELSQEVKIIKRLPAEWGICSRTGTLSDRPQVLTCWGGTIVVSLESEGIIILDGITGSQVAILSKLSEICVYGSPFSLVSPLFNPFPAYSNRLHTPLPFIYQPECTFNYLPHASLVRLVVVTV